MHVAVVIQARMSSSRLPGKVLLPLAGRPALARVVERVRAARTPSSVCVATTSEAVDQPIVDLCAELGVDVYRGHPSDLLDRHYRAGQTYRADAVVKIPSDCPLIEPAVIDTVIGAWLRSPQQFDFVTNLHPPTWPDGNDVELMTMQTLHCAWQEATRPFEREHTTPFIWERPTRFRTHNVVWENGLDYSQTLRFTLDYPEDYAFIRAVYERLAPVGPLFALEDILALLVREPELLALNARYAGVSWHRAHLAELCTIVESAGRLRYLKAHT